MRTSFPILVVLAAVLAVTHQLGAQADKTVSPPPVFKAGFAQRDITPDIGMEMPGNYGKVHARSIHDPCKVRAAVFDDGRKRVALVGVDALMIRRDTVLAVRKAIQARCGIPPENVMIGASHSHSSGPTGMILPGEFDHASPLVQKLAYELSSTADLGYLKRVEQALVEAVCLANDFRVEAKCSFGSGREEKVSFNRRLRMKSGLTFSHPGRGNPETLDYAGPIDPEVGVIGAWTKEGRLLGVVVNFACHATTSPPGFSANWIHYLEQTIRGSLEPVPVVFLQGACGDITQVDNLSRYKDPSGDQQARRVGGRVGAEAVKVLLSAEPGDATPVDAKAKVWNIQRRVPAPERVKRALELVQKPEKEIGHSEWVFAKETVLLDALIARHPEEEVEVQAIQVGPAVFISNPAELFVQFGLDLKKGSNFPLTFPVELANGCVGYVPTEEAFGPNGGGYETRLTSYSNLEITAGRQFVETGLELARAMRPGPIPEPAKAPPFAAPWAYGNVRPEVR
jgi:neutral ceramidase